MDGSLILPTQTICYEFLGNLAKIYPYILLPSTLILPLQHDWHRMTPVVDLQGGPPTSYKWNLTAVVSPYYNNWFGPGAWGLPSIFPPSPPQRCRSTVPFG